MNHLNITLNAYTPLHYSAACCRFVICSYGKHIKLTRLNKIHRFSGHDFYQAFYYADILNQFVLFVRALHCF